MLRNSSNDYNEDDDAAESSIFDLDHAPAPRVSMLLSPHHNSTNNNSNILLQESAQQQYNSMMMGSDLLIPPPPSSSTAHAASSRLRASTSLSPRPPSSISGLGRMSRKSIVIPMGENNHPVVSLPPTAPPAGVFTTTAGTTTAKDTTSSLSGSILGPITTTFHRRRLSSYSSIPTVGGSYMYGQSSNALSKSTISSNASTNTIPYRTTHSSTRQRSYSAAEVFSNTVSPTTPLPSHLAHVRSFPPPITSFRPASSSRNETISPNVPHRSDSADASYGPEMFSPSVSSSVPIIRIEESKEPIDGDDLTMDDVDELPFTDTEYESEIFHDVRIKDTSDNNVMSDTGFSSGSEQPLSFSHSTTKKNTINLDTTSIHVPSTDPTFLSPNALSGTQNYDFEDSISPNHHHDATTAIQPVLLCGCIPLPRYFSKRRISWDRVASFVAVWSPCFLGFRMEYSTYRAVLFRLNIICGFMAIVQLTASSFHFAVLHGRTLLDRNLPTMTLIEIKNENDNKFEVLTNVWNLNGSVVFLGIVALVVFVAVVCTVRAIQNVNLVGAIRYYWLILWIIPLQAFWAVSMFDYFHVTEVWIKFWWRDKTMAWYRYKFCDPSDTYNTLCAVPIYSNPDQETAWCQMNYNSTACTSIRNNAQAEVARFLSFFYSTTSAWTILFIFSLFLVMKTLESIITSPLVEKSRESSIPSWLMLPTAGCFICGSLFTYSPSSILNIRYGLVTNLQWIAPIFMIAGGVFFVLALLAWFLWTYPITQTSHKHNKSIAIIAFIIISFGMILTMATIFASCIVESLFLGGDLSDSARGQIACSIDQSGSCTQCPGDIAILNSTDVSIPPEDQCPEWSYENVTRVLQSQAKTGANLAVICMFYAIGAFRYGLSIRKHIINYKIAYV